MSFQLSSRFALEVQELPNFDDAASFLEGEDNAGLSQITELLIAPYNGKANELTEYLQSRVKPLPTIFYYEGEVPPADVLKGLLTLGLLEKQQIVEGSARLLEDYLSKNGEYADPNDFCPIHTSLLMRTTPLKSDIYIKLSKNKFVKLFHSGAEFDQSDLERYYKVKKIEFMYLKRSETAEFMGKFSKELDLLLSKEEITIQEAAETMMLTQEMIQELVHRVGFSAEVQELARKNVALTIKAIGTSPKLLTIISQIHAGANYIAQHSSLLAYVGCCLAKEMSWGSDSTFSKLVIAAYMHDISLTNPKLAKINSLAELNQLKDQFTEQEVKSYHLHPLKSADVVKSFQEIPADVDIIVSHHHERPNGTGFPRGLQHNYIAPLAAVFIVAHDLSQAILNKRESFNLASFIVEAKQNYTLGNFKKVVSALEKIKFE